MQTKHTKKQWLIAIACLCIVPACIVIGLVGNKLFHNKEESATSTPPAVSKPTTPFEFVQAYASIYKQSREAQSNHKELSVKLELKSDECRKLWTDFIYTYRPVTFAVDDATAGLIPTDKIAQMFERVKPDQAKAETVMEKIRQADAECLQLAEKTREAGRVFIDSLSQTSHAQLAYWTAASRNSADEKTVTINPERIWALENDYAASVRAKALDSKIISEDDLLFKVCDRYDAAAKRLKELRADSTRTDSAYEAALYEYENAFHTVIYLSH